MSYFAVFNFCEIVGVNEDGADQVLNLKINKISFYGPEGMMGPYDWPTDAAMVERLTWAGQLRSVLPLVTAPELQKFAIALNANVRTLAVEVDPSCWFAEVELSVLSEAAPANTGSFVVECARGQEPVEREVKFKAGQVSGTLRVLLSAQQLPPLRRPC